MIVRSLDLALQNSPQRHQFTVFTAVIFSKQFAVRPDVDQTRSRTTRTPDAGLLHGLCHRHLKALTDQPVDLLLRTGEEQPALGIGPYVSAYSRECAEPCHAPGQR